MDANQALAVLHKLRQATGEAKTRGLTDAEISEFLPHQPTLQRALKEADEAFAQLQRERPELVAMAEDAAIDLIQADYVNFYAAANRNPYVSLAARGPWIVTLHGAVVHDSGGYGMLGFGHAPQPLLDAMNGTQVMANVMTANVSQLKFAEKLKRALGCHRDDTPFAKFICMNSGSESVTVAARISDLNAKRLTAPGGTHHGKRIMFLALKGGFHGRTDRPAQASSSTLDTYQALASFAGRKNLMTVEPNDVADLERAFAWADKEGVFFEMLFMEPVMGEGDPGRAITPEFYRRARELTAARGTLLLVDAIQAAIRVHGCLSLVDYPGFTELPPPDMETFSKALNGGQYPLSVLAMNASTAEIYIRGVYGNTMTTNPRALDVGSAVLDLLTPHVAQNIVERGHEMVAKLEELSEEFPGLITKVQGTGLLLSAEINPERAKVIGYGHLEEQLRMRGIGVIHGGENSLRFTPHFEITTQEVDLMIQVMREVFKKIP